MANLQKASPFSLDGMVVAPFYDVETITEELPKLTRSVKVDDHANAPTTTIVDIEWQTSSFGVLVPKAIVAPVKFGNVTVKQAALHNVKWAQDRGAGIGAVVRILRSGEIIPKIVEVVTPADFVFPDTQKYGPYSFDGVRIILSGDGMEIQSKKIQRMIGALGLEDLGSGFADKLVAAGITSTRRVVDLSLQEIQALPGVKTSAKKIYAQISRVHNQEFTMPELMNASGIFKAGLGITLLNKLASDYPSSFRSVESLKKLGANLNSVSSSIGPARASVFKEGLVQFCDWVEGIPVKPFKVKSIATGPLSGQFFSWTGYRSEQEETLVTSLGGQVVSFGSKTTTLFFKPGGKSSSKVEKAGSKAITFERWHTANRKVLDAV
jgi:DNA ligase (NAD+)